MFLRSAALAALVAVCAQAPVAAGEPLSLDDAFARVAEAHPDLRLFDARRAAGDAERDAALLRPAFVAGAELENAFGSGDARALDGAELTLTLASVLERGGKLDARRALAQTRIDALAVERETRRLDLLADTARRYLNVVAAQRAAGIAARDIAQRQAMVAASRRRFEAGAAPESTWLAAQAAEARAGLDRDRALEGAAAARRALAALWGGTGTDIAVVDVDPHRLPALPDYAGLERWLDATPDLARFADERRVADARGRLARAGAVSDLDWQLGVRRRQGEGDVGLVAGVSFALGARARGAPDVRAAEAEAMAADVGREAAGRALRGTLADAHGRYEVARLEVARLGTDVVPKLARAEAAAGRAYRAGATTPLEWMQLQADLTETERRRLDAAVEAQRALIELQRLTGQPLATPASAEKGDLP